MSRRGGSRRSQATCFKCGTVGHYAKKCPNANPRTDHNFSRMGDRARIALPTAAPRQSVSVFDLTQDEEVFDLTQDEEEANMATQKENTVAANKRAWKEDLTCPSCQEMVWGSRDHCPRCTPNSQTEDSKEKRSDAGGKTQQLPLHPIFTNLGKVGGKVAKGKRARRSSSLTQRADSPAQPAPRKPKHSFETPVENAATAGAVLSESQQRVVHAIQAKKNVLITGCAGTGKTFLMSYLLERVWARQAGVFITASTGIAAVALGGTTVHSFAGVGLGRESVEVLIHKVKKSQAGKRWREATVLIIDEISMLEAAFFDKLEQLARGVRECEMPFGNLQLVLTGDFLQLPPVAKASDAHFVFEAKSWKRCIHHTFELQQVFRQKEGAFVSMLAELRRGVCSEATQQALTQCKQRQLDTSDGIQPTTLYSTKKQVEAENDQQLSRLTGETMNYHAQDAGQPTYLNMLQRSCPAPATLTLKPGAQVMLVKNLNLNEGLCNGSRGVVVKFDTAQETGAYPVVRFANGKTTTLHREKWEVVVGSQVVASRNQVPLILAWSLTIHKCQGMTIDRAVLSLGSVFEYGQAYVALSRVRDLSGLKLLDFQPSVVKAHPRALDFYNKLVSQPSRSHQPSSHNLFSQPSRNQPSPSPSSRNLPIPDPSQSLLASPVSPPASATSSPLSLHDLREPSKVLAPSSLQLPSPSSSSSLSSSTSFPGFQKASSLSSVSAGVAAGALSAAPSRQHEQTRQPAGPPHDEAEYEAMQQAYEAELSDGIDEEMLAMEQEMDRSYREAAEATVATSQATALSQTTASSQTMACSQGTASSPSQAAAPPSSRLQAAKETASIDKDSPARKKRRAKCNLLSVASSTLPAASPQHKFLLPSAGALPSARPSHYARLASDTAAASSSSVFSAAATSTKESVASAPASSSCSQPGPLHPSCLCSRHGTALTLSQSPRAVVKADQIAVDNPNQNSHTTSRTGWTSHAKAEPGQAGARDVFVYSCAAGCVLEVRLGAARPSPVQSEL
eukprot:g85.t1